MTGGLTQTQQRLEDVHSRLPDAESIDAIEDAVPIRREQRVIELALRTFEHDTQGLLSARREVLRNLLLGSTKDHRPKRACEEIALCRRRTRRRFLHLGQSNELREPRC